MSKGGSTSTKVKIPAWVEDQAQQNLKRANDISQIGYTPYFGLDVAALTPQQEAAFANTNAQAGAFGMQGGAVNMPQAQTINGVSGYSAAPLYNTAVAELQGRRPGQHAAIMSQFVNPWTGASPQSTYDQPTAPTTAAVPTGTYRRTFGDFGGLIGSGGEVNPNETFNSPMVGGSPGIFDAISDRLGNSFVGDAVFGVDDLLEGL